MRVDNLTVLLLLATVAPVLAQTAEDPVETARIQVGPLGLTPSVALTNFGVDTNVFNEVDDPKQDFTFTASPRVDAWFRAGRSRTAIQGSLDLVYFQKYLSERSVDGAVTARLELRGNRVTPWAAGGFASGRQRVGYEIDLRSRQVTKDVALGVEGRLTAKTRVELSAALTEYSFDGDA